MLNAILFAERGAESARVLDNRLWSQHGCYWQTRMGIREGRLFNEDAQAWQRALHCGGTDKFWTLKHLARVAENPAHVPAYAWFLRQLWLGRCRLEANYLDPEQRHLAESFARWENTVRAFEAPGALAR